MPIVPTFKHRLVTVTVKVVAETQAEAALEIERRLIADNRLAGPYRAVTITSFAVVDAEEGRT